MSFSSSNTPTHQASLQSNLGSPLMDYSEMPLLEQTFRMIPDVVSIYDVDAQRVVYSNRSLMSVLGYEDDSKADQSLLHPNDVTDVDTQFHRLLNANDDESVDVRYRLKQANGNWKWFSERQVIFKRHGDGKVAQILKTIRDTREEQESSQPVPINDRLYHVTEYNLPNFAFMLFDHDMRYTLATGVLLRRMGLLKKDTEGHTLREVMQPEIADWLEPAFQAALAGTVTNLERVIGGIIVSIQCLPVRNDNGEITAGMVLAEDITDEKQAMAALIESEQRFAQFSENMQALFWMMDVGHQKPLYFSSAFENIWGLAPELALDNPALLMSMVHPDDREIVIETFAETFITGQHEIKFRIVLPSGKLRWLSSRAFPIYDDQGVLYRIAGIADDITQQMEVEKVTFDLALEQEHMRLLSQFIGTTSHELRTPLTIINTSLYLLRKTNDPSRQDERLGIIEHQVAQLARLIGQMHMLLRVESTSPSSHANPAPLNKMLTNLEEEYAPAIAKKELTLELVLDDALPNLKVDPDLLLVALQNVLENAITYTNAGTIRVQTLVQGDEVVVSFEDSGSGISDEDLPHIFERFYKIEKEKKRNTVAAGLGLAITQRIMKLIGGRIEIESQVDQGSVFRLIWPISA